MRLRLDLEIPQWTQWLAGGIAIGVIIGVGAARVYADPITVKTDWQPGQPLNAADLNKAFKALQDELNRQKHPDCPEDYLRDTAESRFVVCKKVVNQVVVDQVVKVGNGGSAFWIDRYEAGIYVDTTATGTQYGVPNGPAFPAVFPENGEYPDGDNDVNTPPFYLYAVSLPGKPPSASMTWFQAQAACRLNGKRLPTGEEWLAASVGTMDPASASAGANGTCVTSATGPRNTGGGTACVSVWGAEDMIGNVWEWTTDWYAGVGTATGADYGPKPWTGAAYNGDGTWGVVSGAYDATGPQPGLPAPGVRGGSWLNGTSGGRFALAAVDAPSRPLIVVGFRCVTPR